MSQKGDPDVNNNAPQNPNFPPPHRGRHRHGMHGQEQFQKSYQMTDEEKGVLRECQSESFWYRAMPLAVSAGLVTQTLISRGSLTTKSKFGSLPKVGFACLVGYMAGKVSYVSTCKQKFLKLENSPIGEMLRKGGGMPPGQAGNFGLPSFSSRSEDADPSGNAGAKDDSYSGFGQSDDYRATLDIDTSNVKSMDNQFDFELSNEAASELKAKRPEMTKTYEDLRKENRQMHSAQYTQALPGHYQPRQAPRSQDDKVPQRDGTPPFTTKSRSKVLKNQYGDDMES